MEGEWRHAKDHVNRDGGTRDNMIQERLDEYIFMRTYLRDQPFNVFIMLRLLAKYGKQAKEFLDNEKKNKSNLSDKDTIYYRCEEIEEDEQKDENNGNDNVDEKEDEGEEEDMSGYTVDDNGNLIRCNEYGDIVEVHYADPDRRDVDLDHQLSQLQPDEHLDMNEDAVYESTFDIEEEDPQLSEQIVQYFNSQ